MTARGGASFINPCKTKGKKMLKKRAKYLKMLAKNVRNLKILCKRACDCVRLSKRNSYGKFKNDVS